MDLYMSPILLAYRTLPVKDIVFTKNWNLHPWEAEVISDSLLQSFKQIGVIHKPILIAKNAGVFEVLCGFKRLQFLLTYENARVVECLVLPEDTEISSILEILLTDQNHYHPLSLAEQGKFVEICSRFFSHQEIVSAYLEKIRIRRNISSIKLLLLLLQQDPFIITEAHAGRLQEKMVAEILRLPESSDRLAFVKLFKDLSMGDGKQKKFFTLIRDLAFRQNSTIADYLSTPAISSITNHPVLNIPQKIQHLNTLLQHQLNPHSTMAEEKFSHQVQALQLPPRCSISHSLSFENDTVTLSISFDSLDECARVTKNISAMLPGT
jgi:hypothetical protein